MSSVASAPVVSGCTCQVPFVNKVFGGGIPAASSSSVSNTAVFGHESKTSTPNGDLSGGPSTFSSNASPSARTSSSFDSKISLSIQHTADRQNHKNANKSEKTKAKGIDYSKVSISRVTIEDISISTTATTNSVELMKSLMETCNLVATASYCERCFQQAMETEVDMGVSQTQAPTSSSKTSRYSVAGPGGSSGSSATMSGFPTSFSSSGRTTPSALKVSSPNTKGFVYLMRQLFAMNGYALCTVHMTLPTATPSAAASAAALPTSPTIGVADQSSSNSSASSKEEITSSKDQKKEKPSSVAKKAAKRLQPVTVCHAVLFPMGINRAVLYIEEKTTSQKILFTTIWQKYLVDPTTSSSTASTGKTLVRRSTIVGGTTGKRSESGGLFDDGALLFVDTSMAQQPSMNAPLTGTSNAKMSRGLTAVSSITASMGETSQFPVSRGLRKQASITSLATATSEHAASHERSLLQMINASNQSSGSAGMRSMSRTSNFSDTTEAGAQNQNHSQNQNQMTSGNIITANIQDVEDESSNLFPHLSSSSRLFPRHVQQQSSSAPIQQHHASSNVLDSNFYVSASGFDGDRDHDDADDVQFAQQLQHQAINGDLESSRRRQPEQDLDSVSKMVDAGGASTMMAYSRSAAPNSHNTAGPASRFSAITNGFSGGGGLFHSVMNGQKGATVSGSPVVSDMRPSMLLNDGTTRSDDVIPRIDLDAAAAKDNATAAGGVEDDSQTQSTLEDHFVGEDGLDWIEEGLQELEKENEKEQELQLQQRLHPTTISKTPVMDPEEEEEKVKLEAEQARIKEEQRQTAKQKLVHMLEPLQKLSSSAPTMVQMISEALIELDTCPTALTFNLLDVLKQEYEEQEKESSSETKASSSVVKKGKASADKKPSNKGKDKGKKEGSKEEDATISKSIQTHSTVKQLLKVLQKIMKGRVGSDLHVVKAFSLLSTVYAVLSIELTLYFKMNQMKMKILKKKIGSASSSSSSPLPFTERDLLENIRFSLDRLQIALGSPVMSSSDLLFLFSIGYSVPIFYQRHQSHNTGKAGTSMTSSNNNEIQVVSSRIELMISLLRDMYQQSLTLSLTAGSSISSSPVVSEVELEERQSLWKLIEPVIDEYDYAKKLTMISPVKVNVNSTAAPGVQTVSASTATAAVSLISDLDEIDGNPNNSNAVTETSSAGLSAQKVAQQQPYADTSNGIEDDTASVSSKGNSNVSSSTATTLVPSAPVTTSNTTTAPNLKKPPLASNASAQAANANPATRQNSLVTERKQFLGHRMTMGRTKAITVNPNVSAFNRKVSIGTSVSGASGAGGGFSLAATTNAALLATGSASSASMSMPPPSMLPAGHGQQGRGQSSKGQLPADVAKRVANLKRSLSQALPPQTASSSTSLPQKSHQETVGSSHFKDSMLSSSDPSLQSPQAKRSRSLSDYHSPAPTTFYQDPSFSQVRVIESTPMAYYAGHGQSSNNSNNIGVSVAERIFDEEDDEADVEVEVNERRSSNLFGNYQETDQQRDDDDDNLVGFDSPSRPIRPHRQSSSSSASASRITSVANSSLSDIFPASPALYGPPHSSRGSTPQKLPTSLKRSLLHSNSTRTDLDDAEKQGKEQEKEKERRVTGKQSKTENQGDFSALDEDDEPLYETLRASNTSHTSSAVKQSMSAMRSGSSRAQRSLIAATSSSVMQSPASTPMTNRRSSLLLASNPLLLGVGGSSALRLNLTEEERQATILSSVGSSHSMSMSDAHTDILTDIASSSDVQSTRNRTLLDPNIASSSLITNSAGSTFSNIGFDGVARSLSPQDDAMAADNTSNTMSRGNVSSIAMAMEDCIEHESVENNNNAAPVTASASLPIASRSRSGKIRSNVSAPAPQAAVGAVTVSKGAKRGRPPAIAKQEQPSEDESSEAPQLPSPPRKNVRRSNSSNGGKQQLVVEEQAPAMKLVQASSSNTTTPVANRSRRGDRVDLLGISSIGSDFTDAPDDAPMAPSSVDTETKETDVSQQQGNVPASLTAALKINRRTVRSNVRPPNPAIATRRTSGAR